jgi:hypothetical protein
MPLKILKQGEPFPKDWWNYKINPIIGYEYKPSDKNKK